MPMIAGNVFVRDVRVQKGGKVSVELKRGTQSRRWVPVDQVDESIANLVAEEASALMVARAKFLSSAKKRAQLKTVRRKADRRSDLRREAQKIKKASF